MKYKYLIVVCITILSSCQLKKQAKLEKGLKDYYKNYFTMGVAVNTRNIYGDESDLIKKHYSSITPENAMKMGPIQPLEGKFYWKDADSIVNFAIKNNLKIRGHALCWHEQTPHWIFTDSTGKNVSRDVLLQRLKNHITTVVNRYKGKIYAWDVVNEAIDDNPNNFLRASKWTEIIGDDFIEKAFEYAHEADPEALLFYNDYNTERPEKRERIYKLLKQLKDKGIPIHGVGLQAHWSIYEPSKEELTQAIERYSSLGLQLHFTEVDMSVYKWEKEKRERKPNEDDSYTSELQNKQAQQYKMVFDVMRKYKDVIGNVTFWNVSDRYTWLDDYPVKDRKNYPLLFDINLKPKKAYYEVVNF